MIKKTIIIIIFSFLVFSCGKKGDPEYKKSKKNNVQILIKNNA